LFKLRQLAAAVVKLNTTFKSARFLKLLMIIIFNLRVGAKKQASGLARKPVIAV